MRPITNEIKKSSEFEHGIPQHHRAGGDTILFNEEQRKDYTFQSAETLIEKPEALAKIIQHFFANQVPRLRVLESYDIGSNEGILQRRERAETDKSDHRARHNFGGYIATFQNGYMFGIPVKVEHESEDIKAVIDEYATLNDIDTLNSELGYDASCYGRAFEIHYRNKRDEDRVAISSVFETFLIYDTSVEQLPIAAVRCPTYKNDHEDVVQVTIYTEKEIIRYKEASAGQIVLIVDEATPNPYGTIPIVEWRNNRRRIGDYERVLSQIDLYDAAQSDTGNYMQDLNDAMLVISGDLDAEKYSTEDIIAMKRANLLLLEGGQNHLGNPTPLAADYLYKKYDVAGKEAYNKRLQDDIHKFSHTPDLTDESFAQNSSGVAMKYKVFGLEQVRSIKEKYYGQAIRERYRIVSKLHTGLSEGDLDPENLKIIFTENLPEDEWSEIKDYISVGGELSQRTLLERLSFVADATAEMDAIAEETKAAPSYDFQEKQD